MSFCPGAGRCAGWFRARGWAWRCRQASRASHTRAAPLGRVVLRNLRRGRSHRVAGMCRNRLAPRQHERQEAERQQQAAAYSPAGRGLAFTQPTGSPVSVGAGGSGNLARSPRCRYGRQRRRHVHTGGLAVAEVGENVERLLPALIFRGDQQRAAVLHHADETVVDIFRDLAVLALLLGFDIRARGLVGELDQRLQARALLVGVG